MNLRHGLLFSLVLTGCQDPTSIRVDISVQADCDGGSGSRASVHSTGLVITEAEHLTERLAPEPVTTACTQGDPLSVIGDLVITPSDHEARVGLRVHVGLDGRSAEACAAACGDSCIEVSRRLSFVENVALYLPIEARRSCIGVCCKKEGTTCVDGACVSDEVDEPCVEGADCDDPRLPLELDVRGTANLNSLRDVTVLGGTPPFEVEVSQGEGSVAGTGRRRVLTTGPHPETLVVAVKDADGHEATSEIAVGGTHLFVIGGMVPSNGQGRTLSSAWSKKGAEGWVAYGDLPRSLSGAASAVWRDQIWLVGGAEDSATPVASVWSSSDGKTWTQRATLPEEKANPALWATPNGLIVAGGTGQFFNSGLLAGVYALATPHGTWSDLALLPNPCTRAGHAQWRKKLWLIGGLGNDEIMGSSDGKSWDIVGPLPDGLTEFESMKAIAFKDALWVVGGTTEHHNADAQGIGTVYRSSDPALGWTVEGQLPAGRRNGSLVHHDGELWYLGGSVDSVMFGTRTVYKSSDGKTWQLSPADELPFDVMWHEVVSFTPADS